MGKTGHLKLRTKLFVLILCSMLAMLICMSCVFMVLARKIQSQSEKSLTGFSDEIINLYKEDQKNSLMSENVRTTRLLSYITQQYIFAPRDEADFIWGCTVSFQTFSNTLSIPPESTRDIIFICYEDYFYCGTGQSQQEVENRLNEIYSDERRQSEAVYTDPDGVSWLKNNSIGISSIETEDGLTTVCFLDTESYFDYPPAKVGIIKQWNGSGVLDTYSQEFVEKYAADVKENDERAFRRAILFITAAVLAVFMISLIYTRKISGYVADPIELERMRAKQEKDALEETNRMKTTFLSDVSHELKTPLAAMSGYAQNAGIELANGANPALIQEKLLRISSESNRMALMVTQILDATRIEEGRMVLDKAPCEIESIVRETAETYFAVLNKNNNRLAIRIPLEIPLVEADSDRLKRVFVNLVSNAMKHTHNGTIVIKAEEDREFVKVTVKDTGSGISAEDLPHIWERYYKGKHSETGTGLGLFICRFIIESHGGTISAESEPGKGTSFTFTLPAVKNSIE